MGKILIIKGADFSQVAVGRVDPSETITWSPTRKGTYLNINGQVEGDGTRFDSMLTPMVNGKTYEVHQQVVSNNIRVFEVSGQGTYTHVESSQGITYRFVCPTDGKSYSIQTVFDNDLKDLHPETPYIIVSN